MRSLRSVFVPVLAGSLMVATAAIPALAHDNGYYDNTQPPAQQNNGQQNYDNGQAAPQGYDAPIGPSYEGGPGGAQPQDQANGQYNGDQQPPPPPDQADQTDSNDPGRAAVQQVDSAPPPFPIDAYDQPPMPGDGYVWTPGYWGWNSGWYWVPGVWAYPPYVGALWTPGYWGWTGGYYGWYPGYWGFTVGFYGGIYYGCGYWGHGYYGGYWNHGRYYANRNVNNIRNASYHTYAGEHGPGGFNGRQFHSAASYGSAGHGTTYGRSGMMNESMARSSSFGSVRGGTQNSFNRGFNGSTTSRSYGNSMARSSTGSFNGASPTRAYNLPRGGSSYGGQSFGSRGSYSGYSGASGGSRGFSGSSSGSYGGSRGFSGGGSSSFHGGGGGFSGGGFHGGGFGGGGGFHGGGGGGHH